MNKNNKRRTINNLIHVLNIEELKTIKSYQIL